MESDLWDVLEDLDHPRILVLGDVRLERWAWGESASADAPDRGRRMLAARRAIRPGGAAQVCRMLLDLEADAVCAGMVGADSEAAALRELLADGGAETSRLIEDPQRRTAVCEHFIARTSDDRPLHWFTEDAAGPAPNFDCENALLERIEEDFAECDAAAIVDLGSGACTPSLVRRVIDAARDAKKPAIIAAPATGDLAAYSGAAAVVLNRTAAGRAAGAAIREPEEALKAGASLCRKHSVQHAFITLGGDGIAVAKPQGKGKHVPARRRNLAAVEGAGEIAAAGIALCLATGVEPVTAARLANVACGLHLEHAGGRPIDRDLLRSGLMRVKPLSGGKVLSRDDLVKRIESCRAQRRRIVFTNGCFDLLHAGHATCLQEAAALGDLLVVALNSDASVRALKGPSRPVIRQEDRATLLAALSCVDYVTIFDEPTPVALIELLRPDVLVKGGDYQPEQVVGYDFVQSYGGRVYIAPLVEGVSTTAILKSMAA